MKLLIIEKINSPFVKASYSTKQCKYSRVVLSKPETKLKTAPLQLVDKPSNKIESTP